MKKKPELILVSPSSANVPALQSCSRITSAAVETPDSGDLAAAVVRALGLSLPPPEQ